MTEGDLLGKSKPREQDSGSTSQGFMVDRRAMGICQILAIDMTKTHKGDFRVIALEDNDIDPDTGESYPDGRVRMQMEGQEDFSAYSRALDRVLLVWQTFFELSGEFHAGMAASEETARQVEIFSLSVG